MKTRCALFAATLALAVSAALPVHAQSDTTTTILQGLQNWNSGATGGTAKTPSSLDQLKTTALAKASIAAIDTDRNGTVSKEELAAMTNKMFVIADADGDGQLTETELSTFAANMNKILSYLR